VEKGAWTSRIWLCWLWLSKESKHLFNTVLKIFLAEIAWLNRVDLCIDCFDLWTCTFFCYICLPHNKASMYCYGSPWLPVALYQPVKPSIDKTYSEIFAPPPWYVWNVSDSRILDMFRRSAASMIPGPSQPSTTRCIL